MSMLDIQFDRNSINSLRKRTNKRVEDEPHSCGGHSMAPTVFKVKSQGAEVRTDAKGGVGKKNTVGKEKKNKKERKTWRWWKEESSIARARPRQILEKLKRRPAVVDGFTS
ncbi:hypothetical protein PV326_002892 [Microctonus aethiopoides]|nr:hypothetical protein PV326_002892 [Microctonus aethiopoides]